MAANLTQFFVTVLVTYPAAVVANGNPNQAVNYQIVTPWGKSPVCASMDEAVVAVFQGKGGTPLAGRMGQFFLNQTNSPGFTTQAGQTVPLNANEVGSP
jgi:hypothetical protein